VTGWACPAPSVWAARALVARAPGAVWGAGTHPASDSGQDSNQSRPGGSCGPRSILDRHRGSSNFPRSVVVVTGGARGIAGHQRGLLSAAPTWWCAARSQVAEDRLPAATDAAGAVPRGRCSCRRRSGGRPGRRVWLRRRALREDRTTGQQRRRVAAGRGGGGLAPVLGPPSWPSTCAPVLRQAATPTLQPRRGGRS